MQTLYESAKKCFERRFVHYEPVLDALLTSFAEFEPDSGIGANVILWGKGGFGKSEMAKTFADLAVKQPFVQSFGASSSEEAVWGELNPRELRDGDAISFHLARSFLNYDYAIFEEGLDLPGRILDDLKDTLSARCFRRGVVQHPMRTRCLVICTNHDPEGFRKRGASAEALMQRFPLQVKVEWPIYDAKSYRQMYERQLPNYADLAPLFAQIASGVSDTGNIVAPREALEMLRTVVRRARSQGRDSVTAADMKILLSTSRLGREGDQLRELIESAIESCGSHITLNGYRHAANKLIRTLKALPPDGLERFVVLSGELEKLREKVHGLQIPAGDGGFEAKANLLRAISQALGAKGDVV